MKSFDVIGPMQLWLVIAQHLEAICLALFVAQADCNQDVPVVQRDVVKLPAVICMKA